jgi:pimeloyl-ACP methyl ester carboxylesterase
MMDTNLIESKSRKDVEKQLRENIQSERIRQFLLKSLYWKEKNKLGWRLNLEAIYDNLESMYDGVFFSTRFYGPALFVKGGKSDYVTEDDYKAILTSFPKAEIETIENGTHWVHADEPEQFYQMVKNFLNQHS